MCEGRPKDHIVSVLLLRVFASLRGFDLCKTYSSKEALLCSVNENIGTLKQGFAWVLVPNDSPNRARSALWWMAQIPVSPFTTPPPFPTFRLIALTVFNRYLSNRISSLLNAKMEAQLNKEAGLAEAGATHFGSVGKEAAVPVNTCLFIKGVNTPFGLYHPILNSFFPRRKFTS